MRKRKTCVRWQLYPGMKLETTVSNAATLQNGKNGTEAKAISGGRARDSKPKEEEEE